MKKVTGKILLIDDEKYEKELLEKTLKKMNWEIHIDHYQNPVKALEYLKETKDEIFLIISDMNMPQMTGLQLKRAIDSEGELKRKSIPFIFLSSSATKEEIDYAYEHCVQGYFKKPCKIDEMAKVLDIIIKYWEICRHPKQMDESNKIDEQ